MMTSRNAVFMNMTSPDRQIAALEFFDALTPAYYADLFSYHLSDDCVFSMPDIQCALSSTIRKSPTFRLFGWNGEGDFYNMGVRLQFKLNGDAVDYLSVTVDGVTYTRNRK